MKSESLAHSSGQMSALTLPPSTWCPAVAAPHKKPSGKVVIVSFPPSCDARVGASVSSFVRGFKTALIMPG